MMPRAPNVVYASTRWLLVALLAVPWTGCETYHTCEDTRRETGWMEATLFGSTPKTLADEASAALARPRTLAWANPGTTPCWGQERAATQVVLEMVPTVAPVFGYHNDCFNEYTFRYEAVTTRVTTADGTFRGAEFLGHLDVTVDRSHYWELEHGSRPEEIPRVGDLFGCLKGPDGLSSDLVGFLDSAGLEGLPCFRASLSWIKGVAQVQGFTLSAGGERFYSEANCTPCQLLGTVLPDQAGASPFELSTECSDACCWLQY